MSISDSPTRSRSCSRQTRAKASSIEATTIDKHTRVEGKLAPDQQKAPEMAGVLPDPDSVVSKEDMGRNLFLTPSLAGVTQKVLSRESKRRGISQYRFQPFKKCFRSNCTNLFVPGDFRPSSPRRMFCSSDCFAEHWREQLALVFSRDMAMESLKRTEPGFEKPLAESAAAGHD